MRLFHIGHVAPAHSIAARRLLSRLLFLLAAGTHADGGGVESLLHRAEPIPVVPADRRKSLVIAGVMGAISAAFAGMGQELLNAAILSAAVAMLLWHNARIAHHGREMAQNIHATGDGIQAGSKSAYAMAAVVGLAVLREGSEVALFLYGLLAASSENGFAGFVLAGSLLGLAAGAALSLVTYRGLIQIPARLFEWFIDPGQSGR